MSHWTQGPEAILAPTSMATFMEKHWDGEPLVLQGRDPEIVAGLMSMADMDRLIHQSSPMHPSFRLVKEGAEVPRSAYTVDGVPWGTGAVDGFLDREATRSLMAQGCTFVMESLQRSHPEVAKLSRLFEQVFHCPSPVNLYLTPPAAQGFQPHFDVQNVFVMQLHGTKRWTVYEPHISRPLPSQAVHGAVKPGERLLEITLAPGDLLYLPRGYVHVAHTTNTVSAHLSVSLLPNTWADVFRSLMSTLPHDERFRAAVSLQPSGPAEVSEADDDTFSTLMDAFKQGSDVEDALDSLGKDFVSSRLPHTAGQLQALGDSEPVTLNTRLAVPAEVIWRVDSSGDRAFLHFHGKTISAPWTDLQALRFVAQATIFCPADIPGDLTPDHKCQLAQHLLDEGFIRRH